MLNLCETRNDAVQRRAIAALIFGAGLVLGCVATNLICELISEFAHATDLLSLALLVVVKFGVALALGGLLFIVPTARAAEKFDALALRVLDAGGIIAARWAASLSFPAPTLRSLFRPPRALP